MRGGLAPAAALLLSLLLAGAATTATAAAAADGGGGGDDGASHHAAAPYLSDVSKANITSTLKALPADAHVLIEFYASWCPACRAFAPEYEAAARFLVAATAALPNPVRVFRLDCAVDVSVLRV
jgi:thiol oxidase